MRLVVMLSTVIMLCGASCGGGDETDNSTVNNITNCELIFKSCTADASEEATATVECQQDFNICTETSITEDNDVQNDTSTTNNGVNL